MAFTLPDLPYSYDALEPHIDARTMEIHHSKHHQGYIDKLNAALEGRADWMERDVVDVLKELDQVPDEIRTAVQNNGGGHANHSLFWTVMSPEGGGEPSGTFADAMSGVFGDFASFKDEFSEAAKSRFGSGWAWLVVKGPSTSSGQAELAVVSTANQDSPLSEGGIPILGLDVWEHAYYLNYQNKRPDYVEAWWNVVNWTEVARRYQEAV